MSIAKCTLSCCNSTDSQGKCGSEARRGKKNAGRYRTLFLLLLHCSRASHCYFCTWLLFPEYMLVYMVWNETNVQFCWPDTRINGLLLFICNVLLHVWAVLENLPDEKPENFKKSWNSTEKNWNLTNSVVILSSWAGVLSVLFWMQLLLCSYCEKERWNDSIKKMCDILMSSCCSVSRTAFLNFPHLGFFFIFYFIFKISVSFYYASQKSVVLTSSRAFVRPFYINVFLSLCVCVLQSWSRW